MCITGWEGVARAGAGAAEAGAGGGGEGEGHGGVDQHGARAQRQDDGAQRPTTGSRYSCACVTALSEEGCSCWKQVLLRMRDSTLRRRMQLLEAGITAHA